MIAAILKLGALVLGAVLSIIVAFEAIQDRKPWPRLVIALASAVALTVLAIWSALSMAAV